MKIEEILRIPFHDGAQDTLVVFVTIAGEKSVLKEYCQTKVQVQKVPRVQRLDYHHFSISGLESGSLCVKSIKISKIIMKYDSFFFCHTDPWI